MSSATISVILPVFNAAATLGRALDSIVAQTDQEWECIIVDDGSTDESAALADARALHDPRFRVVRRPHGGIVAALNAGLAAASGALIARMDADDESFPTRFAAQRRLLAECPDVGVASCRVQYAYAGQAQEGFRQYVDWTNALCSPADHTLNRFIESSVIHPTVLFRRELIERHGGYQAEPEWPEDYDLWLRWMNAGVRFAKVPEVLMIWRDTPARLSRTHPRYSTDAFYACKAFHLARGPLRGCESVGIWGAGRVTRRRAAMLNQHGIDISFYIDIAPTRIGTRLDGRPVLSPDQLDEAPSVPLLAYVASRGARTLIRNRLAGSRHIEGVNFWCVA